MKKTKVSGHKRNGKTIKQHSRTIKGSAKSFKAGSELAAKSQSFNRTDSSLIKGAKYNPTTQEMQIKFFNGRSYKYSGVPAKHYAGMQAAKSAGSYFHKHIRTSYEYKEI